LQKRRGMCDLRALARMTKHTPLSPEASFLILIDCAYKLIQMFVFFSLWNIFLILTLLMFIISIIFVPQYIFLTGLMWIQCMVVGKHQPAMLWVSLVLQYPEFSSIVFSFWYIWNWNQNWNHSMLSNRWKELCWKLFYSDFFFFLKYDHNFEEANCLSAVIRKKFLEYTVFWQTCTPFYAKMVVRRMN